MIPGPDLTEWARLVRRLVDEGGIIGMTRPLEPYQKAFLRDRSLTRVVLKSRQVGFSWTFAAEALIHSLVTDGATSIFVSLNHREATEKVRYAEMLHDSLPKRLRGKLVRAGREGLEWANGSRILSFPCRAPRGFSGANMYLDELAFYPDDREVYLGTLPVLSRGGRLTLASTPFGPRGIFFEQCSKKGSREKGEGYRETPAGYHEVPWWACSWMVNREALAEAGRLHPTLYTLLPPLDTAERVERFGSERLKAIFAAMEREAFEREYECRFLEERDAFIPYEEVMPCVRPGLEAVTDPAALPEATAPLYAGFDVGRSVHPSELVVIEREPGGAGTVRLMATMRNAAFAEQRAALDACLLHGNLRRLALDATGMGAPLAEELARAYPLRAEPVVFTAAVKERLAVGLKLAFQRRLLEIPADRELLGQVRSIRRTLTNGGRSAYEAGPSGTGGGGATHGDRFWALALAWHASENAWAGVTSARRLGVD